MTVDISEDSFGTDRMAVDDQSYFERSIYLKDPLTNSLLQGKLDAPKGQHIEALGNAPGIL